MDEIRGSDTTTPQYHDTTPQHVTTPHLGKRQGVVVGGPISPLNTVVTYVLSSLFFASPPQNLQILTRKKSRNY